MDRTVILLADLRVLDWTLSLLLTILSLLDCSPPDTYTASTFTITNIVDGA